MTKTLPRRRTTLQFSQILRTLDLIFITNSSYSHDVRKFSITPAEIHARESYRLEDNNLYSIGVLTSPPSMILQENRQESQIFLDRCHVRPSVSCSL